MAFPFPQNPVDGQAVSHLAADGTLLKATYNASKNCWDVERAMRQSPLLMTRAGVSIPTATADKQVMTWDATANQWVASTIALSTRDLSDVDKATAPTGQSFLVYDAALNKYKPVPLTGGAVLTATTVGLNAQLGTGTVSQALTALFKLARPASNPKGGDAYIVNAVRASSGLDKYSGTYLFDGTTWVRAANDSSGAAAHYRVTSATAQEPGNRIGDLDILNELNNHQLNAYDGTAYQTVFSEQAIKQWIAAGSLFQGTLKTDSELTALPAAGPSNRGFYWTWTGAPSHVVTSPLAVTLQVGDWIQSDGVKYIHVPSDLMSKQRWASVGSFRTWADTDFEQDTLVAHNFKLYRATSAVVAGDVEPGVAGSKWQEIQVKLTLEELTNVNDNVSVYGQDCVLVWDEADQEWTASRTLEIDAIEFDESGPGTQLTGIAATSLTLTDPTTNPEQWAASVYAVKDAISSLTLEELDNTKQLAFAADGDVVSYNATLGRWEGKAPGIASLADVGDVNIASTPTAGQVLAWDTASSRWVPKAAASSVATLTDVDTKTTPPVIGDVLLYMPALGGWLPKQLKLDTLSDVQLSATPVTGQLLRYNTDHWENWTPPFLGSFPVPPTAATTGAIYYQSVLVSAVGGGAATKVGFYKWDGTAWQKLVVGGLESHNNTSALAGATDKQVPVYNATNGEWEPKTLSTPIIYLGQGTWVAADVGNAAKRYGMPSGTIPDPGTWPPAAGDQYIDLATGMVTAFTGPGGVTRTITGGSNIIDFVPTKLEDLTNVADTPLPIAKQYLSYDGTQWVPVTPAFDTVANVDAKISTVVTGLEHGAAVIDILAAPPATPVTDEVYIVAAAATGAWAGQVGNLARWDGAAWVFETPQVKEAHLVEAQSAIYSWNGTAWVKVAAGTSAPAAAAELHAVGDIKQSWLTEAQFVTALGPAEAIKWVLADGRDVSGTKFATITGQNRVPDLRGAFLRAAGQNGNAQPSWNGGAVGSFHNDTTRMPRAPFTAATTGSPTWTSTDTQIIGSKGSAGHDLNPGGGGFPEAKAYINEGPFDHQHTITVAGGDTETAPVHYSVNHYIKIN